MTDHEISLLAERWIMKAKEIVLIGSSEEMHQSDLPRLVENDPGTAWLVVKAIVHSVEQNHTSTIPANLAEKILGLLGAGDLEDLLQDHYEELMDLVILEVRNSRVMKEAVRSAWQGDIPNGVWNRLQTALA